MDVHILTSGNMGCFIWIGKAQCSILAQSSQFRRVRSNLIPFGHVARSTRIAKHVQRGQQKGCLFVAVVLPGKATPCTLRAKAKAKAWAISASVPRGSDLPWDSREPMGRKPMRPLVPSALVK